MKAYKCDVCKEFIDFASTWDGDIARNTLGRRIYYYPKVYHLCRSCATELKDIINLWLDTKIASN